MSWVIWLIVILIVLAVIFYGTLTYIYLGLCIGRYRAPKKIKQSLSAWNPYREILDAGRAWFMEKKPEPVTITSHDGLKLAAWFLPYEGAAKGCLLLMHGYHSNGGLGDFGGIIRFYHELGFHILLPDQRAHGESAGRYITFGVKERFDCKLWGDYLSERFGTDMPIILDGISMGAATVLMASVLELPVNVTGIVADCGFTSPYDIVKHVIGRLHLPSAPVLPWLELLSRFAAGFSLREVSAAEAMKVNKIPVLFLHGANDNFVPTWMSRENYEACIAPKEFHEIEEAGHAVSYLIDTETYNRVITKFLDKCCQ